MNVTVVQAAENELNEAIAYYEEIQPGLGLRLRQEVRSVLEWIRNNSELPRVRPNGYRRVNLKVFPYYIPYFTLAGTIWILAIAHVRRSPEYWLERKKNIA